MTGVDSTFPMLDVVGLHHVGLAVGDLGAASDFYCSCGYEMADRFRVEGSDAAIGNGLSECSLDIAFVASPSLTLELVEFDPPGVKLDATGPGFGSLPKWGLSPIASDPDGRPVSSGDPSAWPRISLTTSDRDLTARLFGLFGYRPNSGGTLLAHGLQVDLEVVSAPVNVPQANMAGRVHVCHEVMDVDSACSALGAEGFSMVSSPRHHDGLQWVFVQHEAGPGFELISTGVG
jgi:catechol 2,3-dioxygenase-like lactoylglutathione lyase family enzyme